MTSRINTVYITFFLAFMIGPVAAVASVFSTDDGASLNFDELMLAVQQADVIVIGETHTDANGHRWQREFLRELVTQDISFSLSLSSSFAYLLLRFFILAVIFFRLIFACSISREFSSIYLASHWSKGFLALSTTLDFRFPLGSEGHT